ncbi:MAG: ATP-binding cassette domain-containing protein [Anaerolineae bacterium]
MTLRVEGLGKRYKNGTWGLRGFSMWPQPGVLAIIGPAGAGKSTLLRMLATVTPPTEGTISWEGIDVGPRPARYRRVLGYLPQHLGTYEGVSGRAFMRYIAALKGLPRRSAVVRVDELLDILDLSAFADRKMGGYPHTIRWRVGLAQALLNDPPLLLVDEAGSSLDEDERGAFYALVGELSQGRTTIVATDRAADVARIAARVGLLSQGRLVRLDAAEGGGALAYHTVDDLIHSMCGRVWSVTVDQNTLVELRRTCLFSDVAREDGLVRLRILAAARPHPQAVAVEPTLADACAYHIHRDGTSRVSGHTVPEGA